MARIQMKCTNTACQTVTPCSAQLGQQKLGLLPRPSAFDRSLLEDVKTLLLFLDVFDIGDAPMDNFKRPTILVTLFRFRVRQVVRGEAINGTLPRFRRVRKVPQFLMNAHGEVLDDGQDHDKVEYIPDEPGRAEPILSHTKAPAPQPVSQYQKLA